MKLRATALLLLSTIISNAAWANQARMITVDKIHSKIKIESMEMNGKNLMVNFRDADGSRHSVRGDEIADIEFDAPITAKKYTFEDLEIHLTSGDILSGRVGEESDDGIKLKSDILGDLTVAYERVHKIFVLANMKTHHEQPTPNLEDSRIVTVNNDRAHGLILYVSKKGIVFERKSNQFGAVGEEASKALEEVATVTLALTQQAAKHTPRKINSLYSVLHLNDGTVIWGEIQSLKNNKFTVKNLYSQNHIVALQSVKLIEMKNSRVVYLSDLEPCEKPITNTSITRERDPNGDEFKIKYARDRCAILSPIILSGKKSNGVSVHQNHRKGLGVLPYTEITYQLDGKFKQFQSVLGLDVESRGFGCIKGKVCVDDKEPVEIELKNFDMPRPIIVDVTGAKKLKLIVDWNGPGNSDYTGWGSARITR